MMCRGKIFLNNSHAFKEWNQFSPLLLVGKMQNAFSLAFSGPFTGYAEQLRQLRAALGSGAQFSAIRGPAGSGKTALLKHLGHDTGRHRAASWRSCYLAQLPQPNEWSAILDRLYPRRFFRKKQSPAQIALSLPSRARMRATLLIDNADAADPAALAQLRAFTDAAPQLSVIFAASEQWLPPAAIAERLECTVALAGLDPASFRELIRQRVRAAGGSDIEPFTSDALLTIHERSRGLPLPALRLCNELAQAATARGLTAIDLRFLEMLEPPSLPFSIQSSYPPALPFLAEPRVAAAASALSELSSRQRQLLDTLAVVGPLTPAELAASVDTAYKDKATAIRAANNLLARLHRTGLVARSREGRAYRYALAAPAAARSGAEPLHA